jgi:transmembrane protein
VFLYAGADRLRHWRESLADVTELGLSLPVTFTSLTIATQLLGGAMVASGVGAVPGAVTLARFTALAALLSHRFWLLYGQPSGREFTTALEHVAIVAALAMFALGRVAA